MSFFNKICHFPKPKNNNITPLKVKERLILHFYKDAFQTILTEKIVPIRICSKVNKAKKGLSFATKFRF